MACCAVRATRCSHVRCDTQMTKFLGSRPLSKNQDLFLTGGCTRGHMLQTDQNGKALGQTTQGISLNVQNAPKMLILKCTSHALSQNQVRLPDCSQQECVRPASRATPRAAKASVWTSATALVASSGPPKIDRYDQCQGASHSGCHARSP